jgi:hypothetical protein
MKQFSKFEVKPIYLILLFLFISNIKTAAIRSQNPYLGDPKVRHSLYLEKDNQERMSAYPAGIPVPKEE